MKERYHDESSEFLTYDEEQDRKYGVSGKCAKLQPWEIYEILDRTDQAGDQEGLMSTGFHELDRMIGGIHKGQTYLLAGRPVMGKTSFALSLLENLVCSGKRVLYLSLEESRENIIHRMMGQISENTISELTAEGIGDADHMNKGRRSLGSTNDRRKDLSGLLKIFTLTTDFY